MDVVLNINNAWKSYLIVLLFRYVIGSSLLLNFAAATRLSSLLYFIFHPKLNKLFVENVLLMPTCNDLIECKAFSNFKYWHSNILLHIPEYSVWFLYYFNTFKLSLILSSNCFIKYIFNDSLSFIKANYSIKIYSFPSNYFQECMISFINLSFSKLFNWITPFKASHCN